MKICKRIIESTSEQCFALAFCLTMPRGDARPSQSQKTDKTLDGQNQKTTCKVPRGPTVCDFVVVTWKLLGENLCQRMVILTLAWNDAATAVRRACDVWRESKLDDGAATRSSQAELDVRFASKSSVAHFRSRERTCRGQSSRWFNVVDFSARVRVSGASTACLSGV